MGVIDWCNNLSNRAGIVVCIGILAFLMIVNQVAQCNCAQCMGHTLPASICSLLDMGVILIASALGALVGVDAQIYESKKRRDGAHPYSYSVTESESKLHIDIAWAGNAPSTKLQLEVESSDDADNVESDGDN